ncbi:MAG: thioredoxin family protein [Simplicispira sp.]|nr:thioredoxin family protein [Simplicispira sp.]
MRTLFAFRCLLAIFFIAINAYPSSARAQIGLNSGASASAVVTTPRVRAELVAHAPEGLAPGARAWLGLAIAHQPGWHTYWKNPGDSGLPTELSWQLPAGVDVGEIAWPVPHRIRIGPLANYGYEGEVLLAVPLHVSKTFKAALLTGASDALTVRLHASWLVCRVECIPEEGNFELSIPLRSSTAVDAARFASAQAAQPHDIAGDASVRAEGERLHWRVAGLPAALHGQALDLFAETPGVLVPAAEAGKDWSQAWDGAVWTADTPLSPEHEAAPESVPVVLARADGARVDGAAGWRSVASVQKPWSAGAARAEVSPALAAALEANRVAAQTTTVVPAPSLAGLAAALFGGLLGGLLLNLMPCVFPVLAIKLLALAQHGGRPRAQRLAALAYTAGVVLSFLALGGLLLALRAAGEQLGWGFQLQSPLVVALLAGLFTLIGLNLAGVFEFGQFIPGRLATLQARHPVADALLSGVVAVAIASPCTAPFMGASLGFAVAMPTAQALAVFGALGLGMALPYLLAGFIPALAHALPRPGPWMDTFRRAMAFPMFATVVWLVWVLGQQSGIDGAGALLALLVAGSSLVWAMSLRGRTRIVLASALLVLGAWLGSALGPHVVKPLESLAQTAPQAAAWQPWSTQRVAELTQSGQPVFVDFTAAWCVTCQYNKRTTLADAEVLADFATRKVALLRADWTRRDPAITAALTALGRSGVPVYVLYAKGKPPVVMSEILSKGELQTALAGI